MSVVDHRSLRVSVLDLIGKFLYQEGFPLNSVLSEGILNLINSTSAYHEEGEALFPEIFITDQLDNALESLPFCKKIEIGNEESSLVVFEKILKLCAPLAKDSWVIYIHVVDSLITYGLITTEISELSPSFRKQTVGELCNNEGNYAIAYLKNVGDKSVLLKGAKTEALISLSLNEINQSENDLLGELCGYIGLDIDIDLKEVSISYFDKLFAEAFLIGHGNLIGVVRSEEDSLNKMKTRHPDGIYLNEPIDLYHLILASEEEKTREASTLNKLFASLVKSMLNHDGVTIFSTSGKLLGYHIFVKPSEGETEDVVGGARSRAFEVMKNSAVFCCCFYKSQDGNEKIWSNS